MSRNFLLPFAAAALLLCLSNLQATPKEDHRLHRVVLDAGHGGKDAGGVSKDKKTYEKNLVLKIAFYLGEMIENEYKDEVQVLYTRTKDVFVPLQDRADYANRHDADLFISIHINANFKTGPSGHSVHVLGASSRPDRDLLAGNLDVCKRENSVILMEDDYNTKYEGFDPSDDASYIFMTLMQGAFYEQSILFASLVERQLAKGPVKVSRGVEQNPFYVLWKTSMPSVLLELGFITNDADLAVLRSDANLKLLASRVFEAFKVYKKNYDETMNYGS